MFTTKFKVVLASAYTVLLAAVFGTLGSHVATQDSQIKELQNRKPVVIVTQIPTLVPTLLPTATPSALLKHRVATPSAK